MNADKFIQEAEQAIIEHLSKLEKGYGSRKWAIEEKTKIPNILLTPILKKMKEDGKIELIMLWSEQTGRPNGSGYCLTGNLN